MANNFDQSAIEAAVGTIIRTLGVSSNVYYNRPRSTNANLKDFVVCKVTGSITDATALGECTLSVSLFAQDVSNMKNAKKLSVMQQKLITGMPRSTGGLLIDANPRIIGDAPDENGYHARIINYSLIIKSV